MLKQERQQHILNGLQKNKSVLLHEMSRELGVSEDTVRRDIKELSAQKLLKEVRGGAIPHAPGPHDLKERENFAGRQKRLMAKKAVKLLKKGQVVILDGGTSAMAVASLLPTNYDLKIITNSFPVANLLEDRPGIELFFAGGRLLRESFITVGQDTCEFYQQVKADICFLGVCSIDLEAGLSGQYYDETAVKKAMIKSSGEVMALVTPEKLNT
ncbi:MAG TPA: DeoR/GlpR family DNA-binding transcription regulator, partial [Puia sp.]|nr:DeoR/GlpR family DNA-binding transcription regulator [Puia sp.]